MNHPASISLISVCLPICYLRAPFLSPVNHQVTPAKRDKLDHVIEEAIDHWESRAGVALALGQLSPQATPDQVQQLIKFFVPDSLGDRNTEVAALMLEAATALIDCHGEVCCLQTWSREHVPISVTFIDN